MKNDESSLFIAKRMLEKRMVDNLDPLHPFSKEGLEVLNERVSGNPRNLLKLSSFILDTAADARIMTISEDFVKEKINQSKNQTLDEIMDSSNKELKADIPIKQIDVKTDFKKKTSDDRVVNKIGPLNLKPNQNVDTNPKTKIVKEKEIIRKQPIIIKCDDNLDTEEKLDNIRTEKTDSPLKNLHFHDDLTKIKVKCPKCNRNYIFEVDEEDEILSCPNQNCDFKGKINLKKIN